MAGERLLRIGAGRVLEEMTFDPDRPAPGDERERFWGVGAKAHDAPIFCVS